MSLSALATRAAVLQWLRDRISGEYDRTRAELDEHLDPTDRKAAQLDGAKLADVNKTAGSTRAVVSDPDALLAWVRREHPSEIVDAIRPAYQAKLLRDAKHYGDAVDESSGELVPGIDVVVGGPSVRVKLADGADDTIRDHWQHITRVVPELAPTDERRDGAA